MRLSFFLVRFVAGLKYLTEVAGCLPRLIGYRVENADFLTQLYLINAIKRKQRVIDVFTSKPDAPKF